MARLIDLRTKIGERLDAAPVQSPTWKARINGDINDSFDDLSLDAPFPLFERTARLETAALVEPFDDTDTISVVGTDPWCVQRDVVTASVAAADLWVTDGTWSGRTLAVQQADDTWRYHRIRTIFAGSTKQTITLYEPMDPSALYAAASYRIYDPALWLPGDVSRILSVRNLDASGPFNAQPMTAATFEEMGTPAAADLVAVGSPRAWYAAGRTSMPAPMTAPVATSAATWLGTGEPSGSFRYAYTLCWGYRPGISALQPGAGGAAPSRTPLWESAPSPVSDLLDLTGGTTAAQLDFTDLAHEQGFRPGGAFGRDNRSGWFRRIYRMRVTIKAAGTAVETADDYIFLADLSCDVEPNRYSDTGSVVPDPLLRMPERSDYFGLGLYPNADATYPIEVRYVEQPRRLSDDYDVVPLPDNCTEALIEYCLARSYERAGNLGAAELARNRARGRLNRLSAQRGPTVPHDAVEYRRKASGRRSAGQDDARFGDVGWRTTRNP